MIDASSVPRAPGDSRALEVAARYAPTLLLDEREPFSVLVAGCTLFDEEGVSPSFLPRRRVGWNEAGYPARQAIEYALWWDWDIGHLYELEHVWTFVGSDGAVVAVEVSWHRMYGQAENVAFEGSHPVIFAQPGKHAMAGSVAAFEEIRDWAEQEAGPDAGKGGVHETELFRGRLQKTPESDARAAAYLRQRAFAPSWRFTKRLPITREMLVPWEMLQEWIPARVAWWLEQV